VEHCGGIESGLIVTEVDEGKCSLGFRVEFKIFKADVILSIATCTCT
jgi:hypothetical protein